jgi:hypothetical protein
MISRKKKQIKECVCAELILLFVSKQAHQGKNKNGPKVQKRRVVFKHFNAVQVSLSTNFLS